MTTCPRTHWVPIALLAVLSLCGVLGVRSAEALSTYYCNEEVPGYTYCPIHINVSESAENENSGYAQDGPFVAVCERVRQIYHAADLSLQCGTGPQHSGCLPPLYSGVTEYSMSVANNQGLDAFMVGHGTQIVCD